MAEVRLRTVDSITDSADERSVRKLSPDLTAVSELDASAIIATAVADTGQGYDFVSRPASRRRRDPERSASN